MKLTICPSLMACALLIGMLPASAATRVTAYAAEPSSPGGSTYPEFWSAFSTSNDLILGMTPSSASGNFFQSGTSLDAINDGVVSTIVPGDFSNFSSVGQTQGGTQLIFDFTTPVNISSISYYGGWQDSGRASVSFTVSYSIDNGLTYIPLLDAVNGGDFAVWNNPSFAGNENTSTTFSRVLGGAGVISNYVNVFDDTTDYLGGNAVITNVKFDFGSVPNDWSGVQELVVTGFAVPEPNVTVLGLSGALLALYIARRKRLLATL